MNIYMGTEYFQKQDKSKTWSKLLYEQDLEPQKMSG